MYYTYSDYQIELQNQAAWILIPVWLFINCMSWDKVLILSQGGC